MKAISAVIVIILILLIVVGLSLLLYFFVGRFFGLATEVGASKANKTTEELSTWITIESIFMNDIYVRNIGESDVSNFAVYINDERVNFIAPSFIKSGEVGIITISDFISKYVSKGDEIKVTGGGGAIASKKFPDPCDSAILCLKFDEASGKITYDNSKNENDGSLIDANVTNIDGNSPPQWTGGKFGSALEFDGLDDYVEIPDSQSLQIEYGITVEAWIKPSKFQWIDPIVQKGVFHQGDVNGDGIVDQKDKDAINARWGMKAGEDYFPPPYPREDINENGWVDLGDLFYVVVGMGNATWFLELQNLSTNDTLGPQKVLFSLGGERRIFTSKNFTSADINKWFHIVGVYNQSTLSIYINGQLDNSTSATGLISSTTNIFGVGIELIDKKKFPHYFDGIIDEVRIYNKAIY